MEKCKSCGAEIVWISTENGKSMPCDPDVLTTITDKGQVVRGRISHFATCPANKFRKVKHRSVSPEA